MASDLESLVNIGPKLAADLRQVGVPDARVRHHRSGRAGGSRQAGDGFYELIRGISFAHDARRS
jgi:hypothetical protein